MANKKVPGEPYLPETSLSALVRQLTDMWRKLADWINNAVLNDLSDVDAPSPGSNAVLRWNATTGRWEAVVLPTSDGYIDGLQMQWVSGTAITFSSGGAYIPSLGAVYRAPTAIAKTSLSLSTNTWYHCYLYNNAGTPDVEIVTTAPAAAYSGVARAKTGDTSRRYLGSIRTGGTTNAIRFTHDPVTGLVMYLQDINTAPLLLVSAGVATVATNIVCTSGVPVTSNKAVLTMENRATTGFVYIGNPDLGDPATSLLNFLREAKQSFFICVLDGSQTLNYKYSVAPVGGNFNAWLLGYYYNR